MFMSQTRLLLLAIQACLSLLAYPVNAANAPLNISFPASPPQNSNVIQDNFLGISFELNPFNTLWGESPSGLPTAMINYLSNIRARMTNPLRIRIGGNSMDASTYDPNQSPMIILTDPNAYFNDVPVSLGPVFFDVLNAMADTVGEMQYIIGLSMQDPSNDTDVVQLAADARSKLGNRLDAMLLGNEPDLYANHGTRGNYTIQDYIPEVGQMMNDMTNSPFGNILNTTIIGGPSICCNWDLADVLNAGLKGYPYKYYNIQHYPNNVCSGQTASSSNISYYLSHTNVAPFLSWSADGIAEAKQLGVPALMTEYNTASCGGDPNVAPTFAAALWAVDVALKASTSNFSAIYLHTREVGITYDLFQPSDASNPTNSSWITGSVYYTELVLAEIISNCTSTIVDLNLANSNTDPTATVAGYGVYHCSEASRSSLVFINFDYPDATNSVSTTQTFNIPANLTHGVAVRYLLAPNITEQTQITWAGQTAGSDGNLQGNQTTQYYHCDDGCSIDVPGPGLAVVWFDPKSQGKDIYFGNSTIAGIVDGSDSTSGQKSGAVSIHGHGHGQGQIFGRFLSLSLPLFGQVFISSFAMFAISACLFSTILLQ